jgi:hypothetical protein
VLSFALAVLGALLIPCVVLLATGGPLPFGTATSATPLRALTSHDIEGVVAPIALYPDALLAQMLAASSRPQEVLDAGTWLLHHSTLEPEERARAAAELGFGSPVLTLLQFPTVLDMMCSQIDWTRQLGEAMRGSPSIVVDVVQQLRRRAVQLGNLRSTLQQRVLSQPDGSTTIVSVRPVAAYIYVPIYDPDVVFTTSSLERAKALPDRIGVQAVLRYVAFAGGVRVADAFDANFRDGYASAQFSAYFDGRLMNSGRDYRPTYGAGFEAAQGYRRPKAYAYAYDARRLGVMNADYFRRFAGNANLRAEQSTIRLTDTATARR